MTTMEATSSAAAAPEPVGAAHHHRAAGAEGARHHRARRGGRQPLADPRLPARRRIRQRHGRDRCRRQPLPGLRGRHRGLLDRPCAPEGGGRDQGAGGTAHPHRRHRLLRAALPGADGAAGGHRPVPRAGARVPDQLGHRGGGGRDQARPLSHPSARDHRLRGRLPRPHDGRAEPDELEDQAARRLRTAAADGPPRTVPAHPRRGARDRAATGPPSSST